MKITQFTLSLFLSLSMALLGSGNALAHAHLEKAVPAKDSVVNTVPSTVDLHFTEALEVSMSKLAVKNLESGKVVSEEKPHTLSEDERTLQVAIKDPSSITKKTRFEVSWKAVSKDSHKMPGKYEFTFDPAAKKP